MASSGGRRIVHIKDVFPDLDIPNKSRHSLLEDNDDDDDTDFSPTDDVKTSANTSEVFFGNPANGIFRKDTSKKRRAPAPPVLIDIDVGFLDQLTPEDGASSPDSAGVTSGVSSASTDHTSSHESSRDADDEVKKNNRRNGIKSRDLPPPPPPPPHISLFEEDDFPTLRSRTQDMSPVVKEQVPPAPPSPPASISPPSTPAPPPPPLTPRVVEEEEDECFVDFDDEDYEDGDTDDDVLNDNSQPRLVYKEYHGEDFSSYLVDEEYMYHEEKKPKVKRRLKKRKGAKPPTSPHSSTSISSNENSAKKSLRHKLGQIFGKSNEVERPTSPLLSNNSIHTFTFADAKIGVTLGDKDLDDNMSTRMYEKNPNSTTKSNRRSGNRWWNKETLSAHSTSSNSDILLKARRNSVSDMSPDGLYSDNMSALSDPTMNSSQYGGSTEDFESYRKNLMYNTKRKNKKWSRFFKRGSEGDVGNMAINPLSDADGSGF